mgnify:CR=1 FL=1|tara:strand:- start:13543 stop:15234 length:1692 start_codon:yes stop_codon:yes gene_type:complete
MDISKHPINSSNRLTPQTNEANRQQASISTIQDLKLEAGKVYSGTVIDAKQATTVPGSNQSAPAPAPAPENNKEWLVLVKGQTIIISSDKTLENGQKLLLKLDPSSTLEKPSLMAQLVTTRPTTANSTKLAQLLSATQTPEADIKIDSLPSSTRLEKTLIKPLLQAINITLDKQLPLQQGFDQLSLLASRLTTSSQTTNEPQSSSIDPKLITSIKQIILDKLPKLNEIVQTQQTPVSSTPLSGNYLKQSLIDSGLFFEKNLLSKPEFLNAFNNQLKHLNQALNQSKTLQSQLPQSINSTRDKIQQTIEALLQLASSTLAKQNTNKPASEAGLQINDLKASLLSASALLNKQLATELSASEVKNLFLGRTPDSLLVSPFTFPMLPSTRINQSKALFDSQELSTGQLLKLLAGMIHKLQFNQLNSLMQSNSGAESALQQTWFFELPLFNPNQTIQTFNFRLDKEQKESMNEHDAGENELQWKLLLSFDLASLGPVYVQVTLSNNTISPVLWADQQSTLALLEKESGYFKSQLENIGLNVNDILCQKGQPSSKQTQLDRHLVDTKA